MASILDTLKTLNVSNDILKAITQLDSIYKNLNRSTVDLITNNADEENLNNNLILIELKKSLESDATTSQNPSKEELKAIQEELLKKKIAITKLSFTEATKKQIIERLKKTEEELTGFIKQLQTIKADEERKKAYKQAKEALRAADIEVIKDVIKKKKSIDIKDITKLYKLTDPSILNLGRYFSLKDEIAQSGIKNQEALKICINLIAPPKQAGATAAPLNSTITLSSLGKIAQWSHFKISLKQKFTKKKLEVEKLKKEANASTSTSLETTYSTDDLNTLRQENYKLSDEVSELKQKISSLQTSLAKDVESNKNNLENDTDKSDLSVNSKTSNSRIKVPQMELETEIANVKGQLDKKVTTITNLEKNIEDFQKKLAEKEHDLAAERTNSTLRGTILDRVKNITATNKKEKSLQEKISELEQREKKISSQLSEKEALLRKTQEHQKGLEQQLELKEQDVHSANDRLDNKLIEYDNLTKQLDEEKQKTDSLTSELEQATQQASELKDEKQQLSVDLEQATKLRASLEQQIKTLTDSSSASTQDLTSRLAEKENLLRKTQEHQIGLEQQLELKEQAILKLHKESTAYSQKTDSLTSELEQATQQASELKDEKQQLSADLEQATKLRASLEQEIKTLTDSSSASTQDLTSRLAEKENLLRKTQEHQIGLEQQLELKEQAILKLHKESTAYSQKTDSLTSELEQATQQASELKDEKQQLSADLEQATKLRASLEQQINTLTDSSSASTQDLTNRLAEKENLLQETQEHQKELKKQLELKEQDLHSVNTHKNQLENKLRDLLENSQKEDSRFKIEYDNLTKQLDEEKHKAKSLKQQLENLQNLETPGREEGMKEKLKHDSGFADQSEESLSQAKNLLSDMGFQDCLKQGLKKIIEAEYKKATEEQINNSHLEKNYKNAILKLKNPLQLVELINEIIKEFSSSENETELHQELQNALIKLMTNNAETLSSNQEIIRQLIDEFSDSFSCPNADTKLSVALKNSQCIAKNITQQYILAIDTLKAENPHPIITSTLLDIAKNSAINLFKSARLPNHFPTKIQDEISKLGGVLNSYLLNNINELAEIIENTSDQNELSETIFTTALTQHLPTLIQKLSNSQNVSLTKIIQKIGEDTLLALCAEDLAQHDANTQFEETKTKLNEQIIALGLVEEDYSAPVKKLTTEIISQVFAKENIQKALIDAKSYNNSIDKLNLLQIAREKLKINLQKILNAPPPILNQIPEIGTSLALEKIQNDIPLTESDLKNLNPVLQYANNEQDFSLALQAIYPHCPAVSSDLFAKTRHLLRNDALNSIKKKYPDSDEIDDIEGINVLNTKSWLEKKYQLITGKSIGLKLANAAGGKFYLSNLELAAVTHKSATELELELKDLNKFNLKLIATRYKQFLQIEEQLFNYPALADIEAFRANLNIKLPIEHPKDDPELQIDIAQTKNLLHVIDRHIKGAISKWSLFTPVNGELINEIFADPQLNLTSNNSELTESDTKKIIGTALLVLSNHHGLADTLNKRKQWEESIKLAYAMTKEVTTAGQKIADRITKLEEMQDMKASQMASNTVKGPGFVFLSRDCEVIDNAEILTGAYVKVNGSIFQKRDELKLNQTVTYKQKLSDNKYQIWSVERIAEDSLEYRTPGKSNAWYKDFGKTPEEVMFTQMIDAVNSFKNSKTVHFSFGDCSKDLYKKYRLFISAYNQLNSGPKLYCKDNDTKEYTDIEIEAEKDKIRNKLTLYKNELTMTHKQLNDLEKNNSNLRSTRSKGV